MSENKFQFSAKHFLINKANSTILLAAAITAAVVAFSIVASRTLIQQLSYQNSVIALKDDANRKLKANVQAADSVVNSYESFESSQESVIGTADKNSKIILDALPSKYDFPALASSLESLIKDSGGQDGSITGVDNEAEAEQSSVSPNPIEIPFKINAKGSVTVAKELISRLERSIRPVKINSLEITAMDKTITVAIDAVTYYQPEKLLGIEESLVLKNGQLQSQENK